MNYIEIASEMKDECLNWRLRKLNRELTAIYDFAFKPLKLKASQANIVMAIALLGPCPPGEIGKVLSLERSTVSRNIDVMRNNGWITVTESEAGRITSLSISAEGKKLIKKIYPAWKKAQKSSRALLAKNLDFISKLGCTK